MWSTAGEVVEPTIDHLKAAGGEVPSNANGPLRYNLDLPGRLSKDTNSEACSGETAGTVGAVGNG